MLRLRVRKIGVHYLMLTSSATSASVLLGSVPNMSRVWILTIAAVMVVLDIMSVSAAVIPLVVSLVWLVYWI